MSWQLSIPAWLLVVVLLIAFTAGFLTLLLCLLVSGKK